MLVAITLVLLQGTHQQITSSPRVHPESFDGLLGKALLGKFTKSWNTCAARPALFESKGQEARKVWMQSWQWLLKILMADGERVTEEETVDSLPFI